MKETRASKLTVLVGSLLTIGGLGWILAIWMNRTEAQSDVLRILAGEADRWSKMLPYAVLLLVAGLSLILGITVQNLKEKPRAVRAANFSYSLPYSAALLWLLGGNFYYRALSEQQLVVGTPEYERLARLQSVGFLLMAAAIVLFLTAVYLKSKYQIFNGDVILISSGVLLLVGWIIRGSKSDVAREQALMQRYGLLMLIAGALFLAFGVMFLILQKEKLKYEETLQLTKQRADEASSNA